MYKLIFSIKTITLLFLMSALLASEVIEYMPYELVTPERADIMAKYIYAKQRDWNTSCDFGLKTYYHHLKVWNNFFEEEPKKKNFEDFKSAFDSILNTTKGDTKSSFPPIQVNQNGIIRNGSHRLVAHLLYNKPIKIKKIQGDNFCVYFDFFKKRNLDEKYLDAMALEYCQLKSNSYIMVIYPSAEGQDDIVSSIIKKHARVIYQKNIFLSENGGLNLILTAYKNDSWTIEGYKNNYSNVRYKSNKCFPKKLIIKNPMKVYLLEAKDLSSIQKCKAAIRSLFKIQNDSVHATDTHEQAVILAKTLFNKNSIHCLNYRKTKHYSNFNLYLDLYKNWLKKNQSNEEWFCIDSGGVLAAYGLRDCNDLDFLHYSEKIDTPDISGIESHNFQRGYYTVTLDDILFDPDYHFFYNGVKFCALSLVKKMKINRGEDKDWRDIDLIQTLPD